MPEPNTVFIDAELCAGPHDRQRVRVPDDQTELVFYAGDEPHKYYRINSRPIFYWQAHAAIAGWKAGKR